MRIDLTGQQLDITPAIRSYVEEKLGRVMRHFDQLTHFHVVLSVEKLQQKAEATLHVAGQHIHADALAQDMYAAIDALADKMDRRVLKHKEKLTDHHRGVKPQGAV